MRNQKNKVQKKTIAKKMQNDEVIVEQNEPPFQYLKEKPIEYIPNAHLINQQTEQIVINQSFLQNEVEKNTIATENYSNLNLNEEQILNLTPVKIESNEVLTPINELIIFLILNAKQHLIEVNFLISLNEKLHELKNLEMQFVQLIIKKACENIRKGKGKDYSISSNEIQEWIDKNIDNLQK